MEQPNNYQRLMASIGGALAAWSGVENSMGLAFNAISGVPNMTKAGAIFDAVVAFDARIALLDAAMEYDTDLTNEEKELWACLSARLRKLYKKRHELAHFSVGDPGQPDGLGDATSIAPFFTWNKHARNNVRALTIQQIGERSGKFSQASFAVTWFVNLAQRRKFAAAHRPAQVPEPYLILRMKELIDQKKREHSPPPQP